MRKLSRLHSYDCLRANKAMSAWGVEARVPFLDKDFLDVAMSINPADKMITEGRIEKQILREAFSHLLPERSPGVRKSSFPMAWDTAGSTRSRILPKRMSVMRKWRGPQGVFHSTHRHPRKAYCFSSLFEQHFPLASAAQTVPGGPTVACSTPEAVLWDKALQEMNDPSGRAMRAVHQDAY